MTTTGSPWTTVPHVLRGRLAIDPATPIVHDDAAELTVGDLADRAQTLARALIARGVQAGDRVALWAPNCWQWVVAACGIWEAGAVLVPINTRAKGLEAADALRRTGARALIMIDDFLGRSFVMGLDGVAGRPDDDRPFVGLDELSTLITLDTDPRSRTATFGWNDIESLASEIDVEIAETRALAVSPDDPFEILMTSGTTGEPKGVVLTHGQIIRAYWTWSEIVGITEGDRMPVVSPFSHGFGINAGIVACLLRGTTIVPISVFDPDSTLELIDRLKLTVLAGPPNLFSRVLSHPDLAHYDTGTLKWAVIGAASVPEELVRAMSRELGFERITNAYGLIEGSVVTMTRDGDSPDVIARSAGRAVEGVEIRLVDADGTVVAAGAEGEVYVRGYGVMQRYWNAEQLTRDAITPDGWLRTGDVGVVDEHGNLSIVGRTKEMMIVGGFNAYPAEIESLLLHLPQLSQAAVVGVPHKGLGEVPVAFVTTRPGLSITPEEVIAWARDSLSNYKVPRHVVVVDALPVTPNGKIAKADLKSRADGLVSA